MPPSDDPRNRADQSTGRTEKPAGRVRHDSTGRAVWEWAVDSGRHAIESTSRLLKRLELPGLTVTDYDPKKPGGSAMPQQGDADAARQDPSSPSLAPEKDASTGGRGGFDPYNSRMPPRRGAPAARKPAPPVKPRITQPVRPAKKPGLFARLFGRGER